MRALLCVAVVLLLAAAAFASAAPARSVLEPRPLHAERGRIVDDLGRQVVLRGVNVNALAEYWKGSRFPTVFPLASRDPARMRAIGWNAARLLVSWSRVEPARDRYDDAYLRRVQRTAARLARSGISAIVDFHQDAWGPSLAARPGEVCQAGQEPALGWDGAPAWATLDGGQPRCDPGTRELSPAVLAAWSAFWGDQQGIRRAYLRMLAHAARSLRGAHGVVGIDVMNEPNALGADESAALSQLYAQAVPAIRRAGFEGLVLIEPSVLFSATGSGAPPPFRGSAGTVYAPHIYTGGFSNGPITAAAFETVEREARGLGGVPVLSGEWGTDPTRLDYFRAHLDLQDRFGVSSTLWTWRESCGDPHKVADARQSSALPVPWGLFDVDCRTNAVLGVRRALERTLTRGYVRAAPGRLRSVSWDGTRLAAAGTAGRARGQLVAFVPGRPARVDARGLRGRVRELVLPGASGRILVGHVRGGRWRLSVTVR
jgi:endoglycosylceramidase